MLKQSNCLDLSESDLMIDPQEMLTPTDLTGLELDPRHPGLDDPDYLRRREMLFALCQQYRLQELGPPLIRYTTADTLIWRELSPKLDVLHQRNASAIYRIGKAALDISATEVPQLRYLSRRLTHATNMHLVPAEGGLAYRTFYGYIAQRGFPVTQFLRHYGQPNFSPEPDMIHDCLGHLPPLMDADYAELLTLLGKAALAAKKREHILALQRFSWFSIETGLIEEAGEVKVLGAAILTSCAEMAHALSAAVTREPFVTSAVIAAEYDYAQMQDRLFVAPSLTFLRLELKGLLRRLDIHVA